MIARRQPMRSRSQPILRLLVLGSARGARQRQRGFAMALVLLSVLIALVSATSLALRSATGQAGGRLLSNSRQAREAAETGITAIIGELNRRENRRLLVSASTPATWGSSTDTNQRNPCLATQANPNPLPLTSATTAGSNSWQSAGGNGQYLLRAVRYANRDRTATITHTYTTPASGSAVTTSSSGSYDNNVSTNGTVNLNPVTAAGQENFGHIQLEVLGRVMQGSLEISRATVIKEYQVVPKCCDRAFAGPTSSVTRQPMYSFGNDRRICPGTENLGMVFGFNGGTLKLNGSNRRLQEITPLLTTRSLTSVVCIKAAAGSNNCGNWPNTGIGQPQPWPAIPVIALVSAAPTAPTYEGSNPNLYGTFNGNEYVRVNAAGTAIEACTITTISGTTVSALGSCRTPNYCSKTAASTLTDYQCNIDDIKLSGSVSLIFDTSKGTIGLFFNKPPTGTGKQATTYGSFELNSITSTHVYCVPPPASGICNTQAPAGDFDRLSFFGNLTTNTFKLSGGTQLSGFFVYIPQGLVDLGGSSMPVGAVWSKDLNLCSDFTSSAAAANCLLVTRTLCLVSMSSTFADLGAPRFDWLARSPVATRVY